MSPFILPSEIIAWEYPLLLLQIVNHAKKKKKKSRWIIKLKLLWKKDSILSHRWVQSSNISTVYVSTCNVAVSAGQVRFATHHPMKRSGNDDCEETKLLSHLQIEHGSTGKLNSLTKLTGEACGTAATLKSYISSLSIHQTFFPPLYVKSYILL